MADIPSIRRRSDRPSDTLTTRKCPTVNRAKSLLAQCLAVTAIAFCGNALAGSETYDVSSGSDSICTKGIDAPFGLWTNRLFNVNRTTPCGQYFDFQSNSSLTVANGEASLTASAQNQHGFLASIDFTFSDAVSEQTWIAENNGSIKVGGSTESEEWLFYRQGLGNIEIQSTATVDGQHYQITDTFELDLKSRTAFQFGVGANDKGEELGAAAWLDIEEWTRHSVVQVWNGVEDMWTTVLDPSLLTLSLGPNWSLHMNLAGGNSLSAVPLPAGAWLFLTGLMGLFGYKRFSVPA